MSSLHSSFQEFESWEVDDELWLRDPQTGAFHLSDYKGLGAPPSAHHPLDLAELIGARISTDDGDRGAQPAALYPRSFAFSPLTGKALQAAAGSGRDKWLPPFGEANPADDRPQGLRSTTTRLVLRNSLHADSPPDAEMAMPPTGHYQFLVGAFKTCEARLLALEFSRGLIYHWLPHSECWLEIYPRGGEVLGESSLDEDGWGLASQDLAGETRIYLPTDDGLAIVSINLVARTYEARTVGKRCVGAPVIWQGRLHVPMLDDDRRVGIYGLDLPGGEIERVDARRIDIGQARWTRPVCDRHQVVWMTSKGQVVLRAPEGTDRAESSLQPWPSTLRPVCEFGPPCQDGSLLWQACIDHATDRSAPAWVRLGSEAAEPRALDSPDWIPGAGPSRRRPSGMVPAASWLGRSAPAGDASADLLFPLLESTASSSALVARVDGARSAAELLASNAIVTTTFEWIGEERVPFWTARLPRPWATRAFVWAGHLYLYHPDKRRLPGWRLEA
ncbi:conserved hypothetical protein [Burkholderiales bacterium 8X]|nr:conserved hypothetical protein [Burkholderiales bacterium 8X]